MGAYVIDAANDALLDYIAACTRLDIVSDSSTPSNLTNTLLNVTLTAGDGNGDYTIGDGDTSGRKLTVTAQEGITPTGDGTGRHLVLSLSGTIRYVTTITEQAMTTADTINIPAFDHEVRDPTI